MILLLVGHRGTGKTSLLQRLRGYFPDLATFDLDREIEDHHRIRVADIFHDQGEATFRDLEESTLRELLKGPASTRAVVSLGAGFELGRLQAWKKDHDVRVVWVRRSTDALGRIFLDRPRLDPAERPLTEFLNRAEARTPLYRAHADFEYELAEGWDRPNEAEKHCFGAWLNGKPVEMGGVLTLLPSAPVSSDLFLPHWFELRTDLWAPERLEVLGHERDPSRVLLSFRPGYKVVPSWSARAAAIDWELSLGTPPEGLRPTVYSFHGRPDEAFDEAFGRFRELCTARAPKGILKLALRVQNFAELLRGHRWWREDPEHRAFFPMSATGRWSWYRAWTAPRLPFAFWRLHEGSAPDQPPLLEWLRHAVIGVEQALRPFAAVLGHPVAHSRSPAEHTAFFARQRMSFFAIDVDLDDLRATRDRDGAADPASPSWDALDVLHELGLRAASVTAPLKLRIFDRCAAKSPIAQELESINTLVWDTAVGGWRGTNTDWDGLQFMVRNVSLRGEIAVWGGGGTLPLLKKMMPHASFYSARTGERRRGPGVGKPRILVWASGPKDFVWPPDVWSPDLVFDLDYRENSLGREYAQRSRARYVSGRTMFDRQARVQRVFWRSYVGE